MQLQALAMQETQLRKLADEQSSFVHSSAPATAAWLAQKDALQPFYRFGLMLMEVLSAD